MNRQLLSPRTTRVCLAAVGLMALAGCTDTSRSPVSTAPGGRSAIEGGVIVGQSDVADPLALELFALLPRTSYEAGFNLLRTAELGTPSTSQAAALSLIELVLGLHAQSLLNGESDSPTSTAGAIAKLIHDLYLLVGLTPPNIDPSAFARTGAVKFVRRATGGIVQTGDSRAGILVSPLSTTQDVLVVIQRLGDAKVLPTSLPTSAPNFEFSTYPKQTFSIPAIIQIRDIGPVPPALAQYVVLAHPNPFIAGLIAVQPPVACPTAFSVPAPVTGVGSRSFPGSGMLARLASFLSPRELYALADVTVQPTQCGSASDLSPHSGVTTYNPGFDVKKLKVLGGCGGSARVRNSSPGDIIVHYTVDGSHETGWLTLPPAPTTHGKPFSETTLQAHAKGTLRIYYGPTLLNHGDNADCEDEGDEQDR